MSFSLLGLVSDLIGWFNTGLNSARGWAMAIGGVQMLSSVSKGARTRDVDFDRNVSLVGVTSSFLLMLDNCVFSFSCFSGVRCGGLSFSEDELTSLSSFSCKHRIASSKISAFSIGG